MGTKHCGKRRNCLLRAISPFPTMFSKDLYHRPVKTRACLGKDLRKVSTLVSLCSPCRLTTVETFRYWQIFCVLSDNSTILNCHFEIIEPYQRVLASFLVLSFLSRSSIRSLHMTGHKFNFFFRKWGKKNFKWEGQTKLPRIQCHISYLFTK